MTKLNIKTALTAVTLAAATFAAPLSAQAADYNRNCNDTTNSVAGGLIGGSVGAAIGEGIAGRGDRTEGAILGAIIGGIAGAAIGDGASDCERNTSRTNSRTVVTNYPTRTVAANTVYSNRGYSNAGYNRGVTTVSYGHDNRNNSKDRLYRLDREIDDLCQERIYLKKKIRSTRGYNPSLERRLDGINYKLAELERERKLVKKAANRRNAYR